MMSRPSLASLSLAGLLLAALPAPPAFADDPLDPEPCACDTTPGACDRGCACDESCGLDLTKDECADPAAGCQAEMADEQLPAAERAALAAEPPADEVDVASSAPLVCADGAEAVLGHCRDGVARDVTAGCQAAPGSMAAIEIALLVGAALLATRRRRAARGLLVAAAGCAAAQGSWDDTISDGPTVDDAGRYLDVRLAPVLASAADATEGDGQLARLDGQPLGPTAAAAGEPAFAVSKSRIDGAIALRRMDGACGDELVAGGRPGDGELLGFIAAASYDGTAPLVELVAPTAGADAGCGRRYETDPAAIDLYTAEGWTRGATLGYVWPPGWGAAPVDETADTRAVTSSPSALPVCKLKHPALTLFYQFSTAHDVIQRLFAGCPGEVVMGEKALDHPHGNLRSPAAHAAGGRTSYIFGANGKEIEAALMRPNGVERTAALIRGMLKAGYDYIVIDEITTDGNWADGAEVNKRFRKLLLRVPARSIIAYVSLDLTMYANGLSSLKGRRQLLLALKLRARLLALETYLHTGAVMNGAAPSTFRTAADRVALAVRHMKGAAGISGHEITTIGLSMHTKYPQYNYLDEPKYDLASVRRQVSAIRHASSRTAAQHGIGFYFVGIGDITPSPHAGYTVDDLIGRMHQGMLAFR